jgi:cobyrinic acid a,c-diamide synthase
MRESVRQAVARGLPTLAECGGFMYLQQGIEDLSGCFYPMAGTLPGRCRLTEKLSRHFGYVRLTAKRDNLLCRAGGQMSAHEFHYSVSDEDGGDFEARKGERRWDCVHAKDSLFAGYPHLHLWGNPAFAQNFVRRCAAYQKTKGNESL